MIICPNCQHTELPGALFCSECGSQLFTSDPFGTQAIQKTPSDFFNSRPPYEDRGKEMQQTEFLKGPYITLRVIDSVDMIRLNGKTEFTLGRAAEGQPILPDVDLTHYDAYSLGVSRLHAVLKVSLERIAIMDLGSSNGTRINGQKIVPQVDYPVNLGDIIALGKLKIQVISYRN